MKNFEDTFLGMLCLPFVIIGLIVATPFIWTYILLVMLWGEALKWLEWHNFISKEDEKRLSHKQKWSQGK